MGRIEKASKNIIYGYIGFFLTILTKFVVRTVFIYTIGTTYLGINGLYSTILSVLSLAELGIGTAMNYSLYKPVAENDNEKIKSIMHLYKIAYRWIALIVTIIGLVFVPFLSIIIKDPGEISSNELILYYLIFLFNTVSTYFMAYKYSLVNAEQKNYIQTNINALTLIIIAILQIIALIIFKNFLFYLITAAIVELMKKIFANKYLNRHYKYILEKNVDPLADKEKNTIKKNIKALIFHKIGDVTALQTDNILISSFINITTVGLISNYTLIVTSVSKFIDILFTSLISGLGNLIATEGVDKQYKFFKVYRFIGFWFYGFASIAFIILLNPFIELWIGQEMLVANMIIYLLIFDYYLKGHRVAVNNFKVAAGLFKEDKYLPLIRGIINLVISIIMVNLIGLAGIYIGTVVSGLVITFIRPKIIYNKIFNKSAKYYFLDSIIYLLVLSIPLFILEITKKYVLSDVTVFHFITMMFLVLLIPNLVFVIIFKNRDEFNYILNVIRSKIRKGQ